MPFARAPNADTVLPVDPVLVWVGAAIGLIALGWIALRYGREPEKPQPKASTKAKSKSKSSSKSKSGSSSSSTSSKSTSKAPETGAVSSNPPAEAPSVPSVFDEDEVEITVVTASPSTDDAGAPVDDGPPTSETPASDAASKIEMIYEDEADVEEITSPIARILVHASGQSDGGKVRRRNEDSLLVLPERSLFAVADGMGGHAGGDVASKLAVETLRRAFDKSTFDGKTESATSVPRRGRELACAVQMANQAILAKANANPDLKEMGTTLVAARFSPNKQRVYIGHVGDSRCYRIRGKTMRQLTSDHTLSGLGLKGPGSQALYQAVGVKPRITIDVVVDKPRADDVYLLCSDGLTKMAKDDEIRDLIVNEPDAEAAAYGLIELANDRGGRDNITVILVKVLERATKMH